MTVPSCVPIPIAWTRTPAVDATSASCRAGRAATCSRRRRAARSRTSRRSRCPPRRRRCSSAASSIVSGFPAIALERREEALAERGAAARREAVDRREHVVLDGGRLQGGDGAVAERDDADPDRARLLLDERAGGRLRRLDPGRLEVVGAHAVRHVEGEDHRALAVAAARGSRSGARAPKHDERERRPRRARTGRGAASRSAPAAAVGTSPSGASRPARSARRRSSHTYASTRHGDAATSQSSIHGEPSDISAAAACATRRSGRARVTRSSVGRDLVDVDPGAERSPRASSASRSSPASREAAPELGVARVDDELLAGLGVLDDDHAGVGQLVLARVDEPDRDDLVALGRAAAAAAPSPAR